MNSIFKFIGIFILLSWEVTGFANITHQISEAIEPLITSNMPTTQIGIAVSDAKTGEVLYERNGFQAFTPASNAKLFTGAAALFKLGPDYTFKTRIAISQKKLHDGTYSGKLFWQFSGDPSFKKEHITKMIQSLKQQGIKKLKGDIVLDTTRFRGPVYGPGWSQDDLVWYYSAPISSVIIDQNMIAVNLTPNQKLGGKAATSIADKNLKPFIKLHTNIKTVTFDQAQHHCSLNIKIDQKNNINMTGCWPIAKKSKYMKVAVENPDHLAKQLIKHSLKKQGISWSGKFIHGKLEKNAKVVVTHESKPLKALIYAVMKDSNNIYANAIEKTLGYETFRKGTFQEGANAIAKILHEKTNIDFTQLKLVDGSGTSRYNLITPRQINRLLLVLYNTPDLSALYKDSLPLSGENGTLSERMQSFDLKGKIYAKTGSMGGGSTLSGYMTTHTGREITFSIMMNHFIDNIKAARMLQGKITSVLYML